MPTTEITTRPKHMLQTFSYASSMTFQKLAYYGWRSILFLLFTDQLDDSSSYDLDSLFFWIALGLAIAYLLGGVLGDLLLGNKRTVITGGIFMFLGSILFFFDSTIYPYIPIVLFIIGCGLFKSNLKAIYAKLYLHDPRLLDSSFLLLYLFINIGSFFGAYAVGLIAYYYGIEYGFLTVGLSMVLSSLILLLTKKPVHISEESIPERKSILNAINLKRYALVFSLFAIFCFTWRITYYEIDSLYWEIDFGTYTIPHYWVEQLSVIFYMIIGIYLVIIWSKKHYDNITKLTISVVMTLISFGLSYFLYSEDSISTSVITIIALFAYTFADLLIAPLVDSSIARSINQKFLGIAYGSVALFSIGIGYAFSYMEKGLKLLIENMFYIGLGALLVLSIVLLFKKLKTS
ncbi:MAG: hypothetical protein COA32_10180 [Fluviicola sp.]|nr:MAG: hypothetical protein COA32_10180 [Fluviicola sp.]